MVKPNNDNGWYMKCNLPGKAHLCRRPQDFCVFCHTITDSLSSIVSLYNSLVFFKG